MHSTQRRAYRSAVPFKIYLMYLAIPSTDLLLLVHLKDVRGHVQQNGQ